MKIVITLATTGLAVLITVAFSLTVLQGVAIGAVTGVLGGLLLIAVD